MSVHLPLKWTVAVVLSATLVACGGEHTATDGQTATADTLDTVTEQRTTGLMQVGGKLFSIPSPVQTAILFRKLGVGYQKELPLSADQLDKLTNKEGRALAMGMYGADLAYVTIERDGSRALTTLGLIEKLSGQLDLANAFDKALLDRFKKNVANEDSLLVLTGSAYRAADEYLKVNGRDDVSALVLAGGWLESLYLTVNAASGKNDKALAQRIGEQKRTLDDLVILLQSADKGDLYGSLLTEMKTLQSAFAGVTSTYTFEKPVTDAKTKTTHINSTSVITISPAQIKAIGEQVNKMRTLILA